MGTTTSLWIWIAGSVIVGLLTFTIARSYFSHTLQITAEKRCLEQYVELANQINELCWSFSLNKREYSLILPERVEGLYVTDNKYLEFSKEEHVERILNGTESLGNYLCIKIEGRKKDCVELDCKARMPHLGAVPPEFSLSALINKFLGYPTEFKYELELIKINDTVIIERK